MRLDRRGFLRGSLALAGLGALSACAAPASPEQRPGRTHRVAVLSPHSLDPSPEGAAFRQALGGRGYVEGRNLTIYARYASAESALAQRAQELSVLEPDVVVAVGDEAARAAKAATGTIPIVMADSGDPVGDGLVASLARPGGNVTGVSTLGAQLGAKRLELLRAVAPGLSEVVVAYVAEAGRQFPASDQKELHAAAAALDLRLRVLMTAGGHPAGVDLMAGVLRSADGLLVLSSVLHRGYAVNQRSIVAFAAERGLPAIYDARSFVQTGGLMAYGPNLADQYDRLAALVDRILKGTGPADLPVEQPTKFDLAINPATARSLGLALPQSILLQATEVIQ